MLQEYAVDPIVSAAWKDLRYVLSKFDFSNPRRISRYPKKWKALAYNSASACSDLDKTRITEMLKNIDDSLWIKRGSNYDPNALWIENAITEHVNKAFHAIIANSNPSTNPNVLLCDEMVDTNPLIAAQNTIATQRNAQAISTSIKGIMLCANEILLIDPYIDFSKPKYLNTLRQLLSDVCGRATMPAYMHFCISDHKYDTNNTASLQADFSRYLQRSITKPVPIKFSVIPKDKMHDRFILSDIASVNIGHGLDEGNDLNQQLNIAMLDKQHHSVLWQQYTAYPPCLVV